MMNKCTHPASALFKTNAFATTIMGVITTLLLVWIIAIPPFQNPDEGAHFIKSCANPIVETHPRRGYGHYFDDGMVELNDLADVQPIRKGEAKFSFEKFFSQPIYESEGRPFYPFAVPNTIVPYALPLLTCKSFQAAGAAYQYLFYALRLSFAASFLLLVWFARKIDPKVFVSCAPLLVLPMTINQGAALSADYFSIAAALILAMTASRMTASGDVHRWTFAISLFLIINAKIVYLPLAAVLAIPLLRWQNYQKITFLAPAVVTATIGLALQYYYQSSKSHLQRVTDKRDEQLLKLIEHPLDVIQMLTETISHSWQFYLKGAIGYAGWLSIPISTSLMWTATATICVLTCLGIRKIGPPDRWVAASLFLGACLLAVSFLGIFLSMYLYWSHAGGNLIQGVQGRYFVPLIAFAVGLIFGHAKEQPSTVLQALAFAIIVGVAVLFLHDSVIPAFH